MEKKTSVSKWMPLATAFVAASFVASYMLAGLIGEAKLGRLSSTAAIGYLFVPVYSFAVGLVGLGVGFLLRALLRNRGERDMIKPSSFILRLIMVVVVVAGLAVWSAIDSVITYEKANAAQIIKNPGQFTRTKLSSDEVPSIAKRAINNWTYEQSNQPPFIWNDKKTTVRVTNNTYMTLSADSHSRVINYDFRGRTYLTEIDVLPVQWKQKQPEYLAVLARLRATSHRSMLLVYDSNGGLLYEELLDRCGPKERQYMGIVNDLGGPALIVNVCEPFKLTLEKMPDNSFQPTSALMRRRG